MLPDMALEVLNISHKYTPDNPVLVDVSLSIGDDELVALVGPSGCGKTTLLHCIAGLMEPDTGEIQIDNKCVNGMAPFRRSIGLVMQDQPLYEHLSVEQNIGFPIRAEGGNRKIMTSKVEETIEQLELGGIARRKVSKCSGGERRRVAIGRAIILKPRVLLLDEPLVSLDEELRSAMQQFIRSVHEDIGASTLVVTHDLQEADALSDRVIQL